MKTLKKIKRVMTKLTKNKIMIAIAESCTGGYVSHMITNVPGASNIFERGVVSYSNQAKIDLLKIDPKIILQSGAVSEIVAEQMAKNIKELSKVNIGIGITGIAGPTGGTIEKPVGLVYIGFSTNKETIVKKYIFKTNRIMFKKKVLEKVIELLETFIL
jgi:nicotinamide-nucleotide amidase